MYNNVQYEKFQYESIINYSLYLFHKRITNPAKEDIYEGIQLLSICTS